MDRSKIVRICDKIAWVLLCILMVDIGIFGAGKVVYVGPLSFRHTVLFATALASVPVMLAKWKELAKSPYMWSVFAFFVWVAVTAVMGYFAGHRLNLIITDIKGFAFFALLPVFLCLMRSRERIRQVMKLLIVSSTVLASITVICLIVYLCDRLALLEFAKYGYKIQFSRIGSISAKIPRLYFMSGLYMLCGCAFGIYFHATGEKGKFSWVYWVITAVCLFALLLSYTRSIYLAIFVAAVVAVLAMFLKTEKQQRKRLLIHICAAACVCVCLIGVFSAIAGTNYLSYAFSRTTVSLKPDDVTKPDPSLPEDEYWEESYNKETADSDALRLTTTEELLMNIKKSPIIGLGLGAEIPSRPDGLNEYIYLDVWSKMGIIGLVLYFIPLAWCLIHTVKNGEGDPCTRREKCVWLAVLLGFMAYSYFNPYMNGSMGIILYCCVMAVTQRKQKELPQ